MYHSGGGKAISGLTDGTEYFVIVKKPGVYQLSTSSGGTAIDLKTDPAATGTEHTLEVKDAPAKVGIGASVAVNLVNDTTTAGLGGVAGLPSRGASLSGAKDLTVDAAAELSLTTTAKGGAAGQVAISPTVAVEISNATTQAVLFAGPALTTSGDIEVTARQKGEVESSASGDVSGSKVGIGISLVLAIPTHIVTASPDADMRAGGAVSLATTGSLTVKGEAEAAGDGETEASAQKSGGGSSNVNDKSDAQLTQAKDTAGREQPLGDDHRQHEHPEGLDLRRQRRLAEPGRRDRHPHRQHHLLGRAGGRRRGRRRVGHPRVPGQHRHDGHREGRHEDQGQRGRRRGRRHQPGHDHQHRVDRHGRHRYRRRRRGRPECHRRDDPGRHRDPGHDAYDVRDLDLRREQRQLGRHRGLVRHEPRREPHDRHRRRRRHPHADR